MDYLAGAAPPPGFHILEYGSYYTADKVLGANGENLNIPGFKVRAAALSTRLVWSTKQMVMGGNVLVHTIIPLVNLDISAGGASQSKTGVGDITVGSGIAFHHSDQLHSVVALDIVAPTGGYNKNDLANIGRNYWTFEPLYTMSYINPNGFNGDFKLMGNLNRENPDTHYRSGEEIFCDYSAGWGVGKGWVVGVGGYVSKQFTDDKLNGTTISGNRTRAFAIGPSIKFDNGKGWFITAKFQKETSVRNRAEGSAFWLKANIPL